MIQSDIPIKDILLHSSVHQHVYEQVFWDSNFANHRTKEPLFPQLINLWLAH